MRTLIAAGQYSATGHDNTATEHGDRGKSQAAVIQDMLQRAVVAGQGERNEETGNTSEFKKFLEFIKKYLQLVVTTDIESGRRGLLYYPYWLLATAMDVCGIEIF